MMAVLQVSTRCQCCEIKKKKTNPQCILSSPVFTRLLVFFLSRQSSSDQPGGCHRPRVGHQRVPPWARQPLRDLRVRECQSGAGTSTFSPLPRLVMWTRDELPALNAANIVVLRRVDLSASRQLLIGVLLFLLMASRWSLENRLEVINWIWNERVAV